MNAAKDPKRRARLEDMGVTVIRLAAGGQWIADIPRHPEVFGMPAKQGKGA